MHELLFEKVWNEHQSRFESLARSMCRNREDVEDILSEVKFIVYKNFHRICPIEAFFSFTCKCVVNRFSTYYRHKKARANIQLSILEATPIGYVPNFEEGMIHESILECIESIPNPYQETLVDFLDDNSHVELSEKYGVCLGTIKSRVSRGKAILATNLAQREIVSPTRIRTRTTV
jgi:RNA polymerase sigma factor (sigma-70 family)